MGKGLIACACVFALLCVAATGQVRESGGLAVRAAWADVWDLNRITLTFTHDVIGALDPFYYYVENINDRNQVISASNVFYGTSSNVIVLTLETPRDLTITYNLVITGHSIQDRYGYPLAEPTVVRLTVPAVFQTGTGGYDGTADTQLEQAAPNLSHGNDPTVRCDADPLNHALLRFDSVFGSNAGQIPLGAVINKAVMRLYTDDPADRGTPVRMLRMLAPWDETSTWTSLGNGIDETNGVETEVTDALIVTETDNSFLEIEITAALQAWANSQPNYGWAFLPTGPNGWVWASSENATVERRPALLVEYWYEPPPCQIVEQPQSVTVQAGNAVVLRVVSLGRDLRYQWYKNQVPISGAINSSYTIPGSRPADSGAYFVVVQGTDSTCTSYLAEVTVICDDVPLRLLSAIGNADQSTISLAFDKTLEGGLAQNTNNYAISGGLNIVSAIVNGSQVTLTTSGPREYGRNYTLIVSNLQDEFCFNRIYPNPTVGTLTQELRIVLFDSVWRYHNEGFDLGTAWTHPHYDDSTWLQGPGLLGFETTAATLTALSNQNAFVNTRINLTTQSGQPIMTDYFRTLVNVPFATAGVTFAIRHVVDDGAVFYFNGTEVARYNMPGGPINFQTPAVTAPIEGVVRSIPNLTGLVCGLNSVAVEVHNQAPTSGDILFGAEIIARVPLFVAPVCGSGITIRRNPDGSMIIEWAQPMAVLQETDALGGEWRNVSEATSPWPVTPTGASKFYRVRF